MATRVVIVGGGFAGAAVAARLEQLFRRDSSVEIRLLDRENFSVFTPLLPEVPSGALEPTHIVSPLRARLRRTTVHQAEVRVIDTKRKQVVAGHCPMCAEYVLEYDYLVLALGSVTNFFGLPGVATHAMTVKSLADATTLHDHVIGKFEHADLEPDRVTRRRLLTFVVAGGGFAGVETAAELNDFVRAAGRYYPNLRPDDVRVVLVHPGDRILPEVSETLSAYALRKLQSRGVEVLLKTRIAGCDGAHVALAGGEAIPSQTLIWTAGVVPHPLLRDVDVPRSDSGRVTVDSTLAVPDRPGIFALGDCAVVTDTSTGKPCPPTAQYAIRMGRVVAENIAASIRGGSARPFSYRPLGLLASLGRHSAVAEIMGVRFSGFIAWWLWRTIYLMKLPGLERKVRVMLDWTLDLFFPRDIVYLRSMVRAGGMAPVDDAHKPLMSER